MYEYKNPVTGSATWPPGYPLECPGHIADTEVELDQQKANCPACCSVQPFWSAKYRGPQ